LTEEVTDRMLRWALIFFIVSLVAALFGFTDIAVASAGIAKFLFIVSVTLFAIFLIAAAIAGHKVRHHLRGP
jgi:uncharacterized membrane protein YtjA (UPF0391 family)